MSAAILSIGTELTRGELLNRNARWLSEQLTSMGFEVLEHTTVDDDSARIGATLVRFGRQVKVVLATGGLGPTSDDLTAAAVASALGISLQRDEACLQAVEARYRAWERPFRPIHEKMADLPVGALALPNPVGSAPGFAVSVGQARAFFMPGVPREMEAIFRAHVAPRIESLAARTSHQVHLRSFGLGESEVAEKLVGLEEPGVTLGYRAHFPEIEVKVLARDQDEQRARAKAESVAEQVRGRLGSVVYGGRQDSYPAYVGQRLRERGLSLALAESCTGGLIGKRLTDVAGSSDFLLLDAVTYANRAKERVLGVSPEVLRSHGAVSAETATAMAEGARALVDSDVAIAITGIAGPGGGSEEKPVGTVWFAVARRGRPTRAEVQRLKGDREHVRLLASQLALRMVLGAIDDDA